MLRAEIPREQISILSEADGRRLGRMKFWGDRTERGAVAGAVSGAIIGVIAGTIVVQLAGVESMAIFGPLYAAAVGIIVGGLVGAMVGWGVRENYAMRYGEKVAHGEVVLIVRGNPLDLVHAEEICRACEAREVRVHARMSDDSAEIDDRPLVGHASHK
jgi:hypothetical protein